MHTPLRKSLLVPGIAALTLLASSAAVAADTMSQDVAAVRLETRIWTTYALNPYLHANDLNVSVHNGKATLTGTVAEGVNKDLAQQIALGISGVVSVDNQLVVKDATPGVADTARSSAHEAGRDIADSWITTKVKSTFLYTRNVDGSDIAVSTRSGIVTLSGKVNSGAQRALVIELTKNVRGVKSIHSQGLTL